TITVTGCAESPCAPILEGFVESWRTQLRYALIASRCLSFSAGGSSSSSSDIAMSPGETADGRGGAIISDIGRLQASLPHQSGIKPPSMQKRRRPDRIVPHALRFLIAYFFFFRLHVILRHGFLLQVLVEPIDDVLQAFHAVPRFPGTRQLVRFAGETHH